MFCPSVFDVQLSLSVFPFAASAQWLVADHSASLPVVAGGPKTAGGARAVRHHGWQRLPWTKSIRKEALSVVLKSAKSRGKMRRWSKSVDLYRTYDKPIGSIPSSAITPAFDRLHRFGCRTVRRLRCTNGRATASATRVGRLFGHRVRDPIATMAMSTAVVSDVISTYGLLGKAKPNKLHVGL